VTLKPDDGRQTVLEDVSVVGFDDAPPARRTRPALTTIRRDVVRKGSTAAAELVSAVLHGRAGADVPVDLHVLPTELVLRGAPRRLTYRRTRLR
jgi:DNA-binding LacI/PurR family transcriptional regulator